MLDAETRVYKHCYLSGGLYSQGSTVASLINESIDDWVVPRFHRRIQDGEIFNYPCAYEFDSFQANRGDYLAISKSNPLFGYKTCPDSTGSFMVFVLGAGNLKVLHASSTSLIDQAKQKCLAKVDKSDFSFLEDLLELRETIRFVSGRFKAMRDLIRTFVRRLMRVKGGSLAQRLADAWLELRFALRPLIISIENALRLFFEPRDGRAKDKLLRVSLKTEANSSSSHTLDYSVWTYHQTRSVREEAHAYILYRCTNPIDTLREQAGLRLKQVPESLWAIIPYSFMVDRIVNITNIIQSFMNLADPSIQIEAAGVVTRRSYRTITDSIAQNNPSYTITISESPCVYSRHTMDRVTWSPGVSDLFPIFDINPLVKDLGNCLDVAAVVLKLLRR